MSAILSLSNVTIDKESIYYNPYNTHPCIAIHEHNIKWTSIIDL